MNPSEPPAEPIVATIPISVVVIFVAERKKNAKKKSAAMVGPSSITPKESVRYEFTPQRTSASTNPAMRARTLRGERGDAFASVMGMQRRVWNHTRARLGGPACAHEVAEPRAQRSRLRRRPVRQER